VLAGLWQLGDVEPAIETHLILCALVLFDLVRAAKNMVVAVESVSLVGVLCRTW
jgi:hypothetical protein